MPDFAVCTNFTVKEQLTQFFSRGEKAANHFSDMVNSAFRRSGKEASLFKQVLGGVTLGNLAANAIQAAPQKVLELGKGFSAAAGEVEKYKATLNVMLGSQAAANARFEEMSKFAAITPFELNQVVDLGNRLQSLGKYSTQNMTDLGDLAAAAGKPIDQVVSAYAKLATGQKGEAVNQFRDLLISTQDWVAATGKGVDKKGSLMATTDEMLAALPKIMKMKGFSGMMDQQSKTMGGITSNLQDSITRFKASAGEPLNDSLKKLIPTFQGIVEKATAWIQANKGLISQRIEEVATGIGNGLQWAMATLPKIIGFVKDFGPPIMAAVIAFNLLKYGMLAAAAAGKIFGLVNTIMFAYQAVTAGACTVQEALNLVMAANPIGVIIIGVAILIGLIVLLVTHGKQVSAWMSKNKELLIGLLGPVGLIINAIIALTSHFKAIQASFKAEGFIGGIKTIGMVLLSALIKPISQFLGLISKIPGVGKFLAPAAKALNDMQASLDVGINRNVTTTVTTPVRQTPRQAPNKAQIDRQDSRFEGTMTFQNVPAGAKTETKSKGPAKIRTEMQGKAP
jgi:hypothetical protein